MSKIAIIMRGLPGSGKSYTAKSLALSLGYRLKGCHQIVSADDYFLTTGGDYAFDPSKLSDAHEQCLSHFLDAVSGGCEVVVVDNTNTQAHEVSPYTRLAEMYGYEVHVVEMDTPLRVCLERQTHGVPEVTVGQMSVHLREPLPPYLCGKGVLKVCSPKEVARVADLIMATEDDA